MSNPKLVKVPIPAGHENQLTVRVLRAQTKLRRGEMTRAEYRRFLHELVKEEQGK